MTLIKRTARAYRGLMRMNADPKRIFTTDALMEDIGDRNTKISNQRVSWWLGDSIGAPQR